MRAKGEPLFLLTAPLLLAVALFFSSEGERVEVATGKEGLTGMRKYKKCEDAPEYLIFPDPSPTFTMRGVRFPVRIIALRDGEVVYNRVHLPGETRIRLPDPDLVIEVPVCTLD